MPLAVIVCDSSDAAAPVAERLARLGYDVHVVVRGLASEPEGDLRVEISPSTFDAALAEADRFTRAHHDAHVLVGPGVLPEQTDFREVPAPPPDAEPLLPEAPEPHQAEPNAEPVQNVYAGGSTADAVATPFPQSLPVEARSLLMPRSYEDQERLRQEELAHRLEEEQRREEERLAQEAEIARRNREAEAEVLRMAEQAPPRDQVALPHPVQPPAAPPPVQPPAPAIPPRQIAQPAPRMRPRRVATPPKRARRRRRMDEWKIAAITATVCTLLLMGAWSLVTQPRPAAPLSLRQLLDGSRMQQETPFGPVTISNEAGKTPPSAPSSQPHAIAPKPQAQVGRPTPSKPAALVPKPKTEKRTKRTRSRARESQDVADDTVIIRHFSSRTPPKASTQANAGLKRYSDMD